MLQEAQVAGELVGLKVEYSKPDQRRQLRRNLTGEPVVSEVEDLKFLAITDLGRNSINEVVVGKRELLELGEASDYRRQRVGEEVGVEDESSDFEEVGVVVGEPSLAEDAGSVAWVGGFGSVLGCEAEAGLDGDEGLKVRRVKAETMAADEEVEGEDGEEAEEELWFGGKIVHNQA